MWAALSGSADGAPPPPPPSYVMDVAHLLITDAKAGASTQLSNYVADDVRDYVNGQLVADGKANWVRYWTRAPRSAGHVLGYSPDWHDHGALMIADEYDVVDRSDLPPGAVADSRMMSRATLYQFAADHKIHTIRTVVGGGFWIKP